MTKWQRDKEVEGTDFKLNCNEFAGGGNKTESALNNGCRAMNLGGGGVTLEHGYAFGGADLILSSR